MASRSLSTQKLVTVFGGSGFLGRNVVRSLAAQGYRVRVACRRPDLAGHLQPLGNVGQIQYVQANLRYRWSIDRAVEGADAVVNLVGILDDGGKQTYDAVQAQGAGWVAEAAKVAKASLVHVSAIGADVDAATDYGRSKGEGERLVLQATPKAIILRPSVIFGPGDMFFSRFAAIASLSPIFPLIGGGTTKLQPVYAGDVAQAVVKAVEGDLAAGSVWELGGTEVLSLKECIVRMLEVIGRKRWFITLPFFFAKIWGSILQYVPGKLLTPGQVDLLRADNIVSEEMKSSGRTLEGMGITPTGISSVLPNYLVRFRKHGQYEANHG
ncbi:MAG: complex I NDUFA9 subunit family protein [Rhizobiaceae bacterium]